MIWPITLAEPGPLAPGATLVLLLLATLAVEAAASAALTRSADVVLALAALNLVTFPATLLTVGAGADWYVAEAAVVAVEAVGLAWLTDRPLGRSALVALVANGATALLGAALAAGLA
ncbi:MAG: hypothetical protein VX460_03225 [Planctomycetota bacterium]|nr:hypothetical protein [Planctomycetota bacterium]